MGLQNEKQIERAIIDFADQILSSYYFESGPTRVNRNSDRTMPRVKSAPMQIDFPIFVDLQSITVAALMLRKIAPKEFGAVPLKNAKDFVIKSVNSDVAGFFNSISPENLSVNYLAAIKASEHVRFHLFIQQILKAGLPEHTFSFPLTRISVASAYMGNNFYVIGGDDIGCTNPENIIEQFKANRKINGWIGCSATFPENAQKIKRIALGAISLRLTRVERTQKTLAKPVDGFVTHNPLSWSTSREHMPSISYDITLNEDDKWWLDRIDCLLEARTKPDRRLRKAIEYFYLGWFLNENDRVPFNLMTLDALFGQEIEIDPKTERDIGTKRKLVSRIPKLLSTNICGKRLGDLYLLRNQFLHGGSPDIYDSKHYDEYIRKYCCDPTIDIELLAASCLRQMLFGVDFKMQPNPYEEDIQNLKKRGLIPNLPFQQTIIQEI